MDIESITPGDDFVDAVSEAAGSSDVVIVLIGRRWLTIADDAGRRRLDDPNDIVRLEIRTALEHEHVRVIPALVDGAAMPHRRELPDDLEPFVRLQSVELSASRFDQDVRRLVDRLTHRGKASPVLTSHMTTLGGADKMSTEASPKYYIYVSDEKVEMLYAQIPETTRRALYSQLDMPAPSSDSSERETDRYSRLRVVVAYIDRNRDVGTVDEPRAYFRGVHEMRWGPYGETTDWAPLGKVEAKIVYFGGKTEKTHFGLGGGLHHVIGNERGKTPVSFHSSTPHLVSVLADELQESINKDARWWNVHRVMVRMEYNGDDAEEVKALIAVKHANEIRGPRQRLEFLAKKLLHRTIRTPLGDPNGRESVVLLGSPIYVALADDE